MPICKWDFQKYEIGQVKFIDHKRLVIQFHDGLVQDPILTRKRDWNQVKTPVIIESVSEIELSSWGSGSYSCSSSISEKW